MYVGRLAAGILLNIVILYLKVVGALIVIEINFINATLLLSRKQISNNKKMAL